MSPSCIVSETQQNISQILPILPIWHLHQGDPTGISPRYLMWKSRVHGLLRIVQYPMTVHFNTIAANSVSQRPWWYCGLNCCISIVLCIAVLCWWHGNNNNNNNDTDNYCTFSIQIVLLLLHTSLTTLTQICYYYTDS